MRGAAAFATGRAAAKERGVVEGCASQSEQASTCAGLSRAGHQVALSREVVNHRAVVYQVRRSTGWKCRECHEVQRAVGHDEHVDGVLQLTGDRIPQASSQRRTGQPVTELGVGCRARANNPGCLGMPSGDERLERCRRAKRHHRDVSVFGVRHEGHVRRHNANPTPLRRRCGRRLSDDGSIVPNERDQRAAERKGPAHGIQPDFFARELVAERCAPLRERCLGSFLLTPRVFDQLEILLRPLIGRPSDDEIREPLTGRGERRPERRQVARRLGPEPLPRGHFIQDERTAAHERVEHAADRLGIGPRERHREVEPLGSSRGVGQGLALGQIAEHQTEVLASSRIGF